MSDKNEVEKRRLIKHKLKEKARLQFENSLPIFRELFNRLFDFLDRTLENALCDDTLRLTTGFFRKKYFEYSGGKGLIEWKWWIL